MRRVVARAQESALLGAMMHEEQRPLGRWATKARAAANSATLTEAAVVGAGRSSRRARAGEPRWRPGASRRDAFVLKLRIGTAQHADDVDRRGLESFDLNCECSPGPDRITSAIEACTNSAGSGPSRSRRRRNPVGPARGPGSRVVHVVIALLPYHGHRNEGAVHLGIGQQINAVSRDARALQG
jgi:hypothetical protein